MKCVKIQTAHALLAKKALHSSSFTLVSQTIAFQIALVSDGIENTYVLLIQDREENCEEGVIFRTWNIGKCIHF